MDKKGVKESCQRVFKLTALITLKESYLLLKNSLGLIYHPFLTLRQIKKERDLSQVLLIGSLILTPLATSLLLTIIFIFAHKFLKFNFPYGKALILFLVFFSTLFLLSGVIYLAYWSLKTIKKNHFSFWPNDLSFLKR